MIESSCRLRGDLEIKEGIEVMKNQYQDLISPEMADNIKREQLKLLYAPLRGSLLTALVNALFLAFILWNEVSHTVLISWVSVLASLMFYRLIIRHRFNNVAGQPFPVVRWRNHFFVGVILASIVWGSGAILLFPTESIVHQVFLTFVFAGITAGSLSTHTPSLRSTVIFLSFALIPLGARLILTGSTIGVSMGALVLLYCVMLIISGRRFNQSIVENIKLRYEAQQREEKLHESEEKYRLLFEKSEDPMWLISGNCFTMANQAAVTLLGYGSEKELINIHPSKLSPPLQADGISSRDKAEEMMHQTYENGYSRFEWIYKKQNGDNFPVDVSMTRIPLDGTEAIFCICRDISAQKGAEHQLIEAKEAAEIANRSKTAFLATISHEVRTPIHAILGINQIVSETDITPQQHEYLDIIQQSGVSLLSTINEILDFSKVEADELPIKSNFFNLPGIVNQLYQQFKSKAEEKQLAIKVDITNGVPVSLIGDAERILQVLSNLVKNAIKFTEKGEIIIKVSSKPCSDHQCPLKFEVIDTGIGISPESQSELFRPFTQSDSSTARKYGGTGLGLAISKRLIDLMGGDIGVESVQDIGSIFWFTLPLRPVLAPALTPDESKELEEIVATGSNKEVSPLEGEILLVEDDEINVIIVSSMLEESGLTLDVAVNGEEALQMYQQKPYDLVLMDCQMPVMDGYQATREIRNGEDLGVHIPIIALTANASEDDHQKTLNAGMDDFMSKPFKKEELIRMISTWLKRKGVRAAPQYKSSQ